MNKIRARFVENYKALVREPKIQLMERERERERQWTWIRRLNIVKMSIRPILTYEFNKILVKIPTSYFVRIDKRTLKYICKGPRMNKTI